jgi:hypothetical protein
LHSDFSSFTSTKTGLEKNVPDTCLGLPNGSVYRRLHTPTIFECSTLLRYTSPNEAGMVDLTNLSLDNSIAIDSRNPRVPCSSRPRNSESLNVSLPASLLQHGHFSTLPAYLPGDRLKEIVSRSWCFHMIHPFGIRESLNNVVSHPLVTGGSLLVKLKVELLGI